jgi:hypothetical protein
MDKNTQITSSYNYDVSRMIFSDPISGSIPDSKPAINFSRIMISTKNEDGSEGDLIFETERNLFSFGVSENINLDTGRVNGYSFPIALFTKGNPTENEKKFVETLDAIVERCKDHLIDNKEEIGQYELERNDLKKFTAYFIKRDKGKIIEGSTPTLYPKLIVSKKQDKIVTMFYDNEGNVVDPMTLIGKYCTVHGAIKIESIFIGNKISLQIKLYEVEVKPQQQGMPRLLAKSSAPRVVLQKATESFTVDLEVHNDVPDAIIDDTSKDETGSLKASDDDEPEPPKEEIKPVTKKVVRRAVKKT